MNLSGAIRKTTREALMYAFDRDRLEPGMSDVDTEQRPKRLVRKGFDPTTVFVAGPPTMSSA